MLITPLLKGDALEIGDVRVTLLTGNDVKVGIEPADADVKVVRKEPEDQS